MPTPIKIKELAFVCHPVADVARARAFYGDFLGLKTGLEVEFAPGLWWIEYDVAGVALAITNASPPTGAGASSVALEVADFEGTLAAVRAAGVSLSIRRTATPSCSTSARPDFPCRYSSQQRQRCSSRA
jgi:catechol 2,3-dioxygenase-like lactoylglutathione lyase family enzyme